MTSSMHELSSRHSYLLCSYHVRPCQLRWQERPSTWFRLLLDLLTPRIIFALVLWARVQCHMCSRMHIHTRAYVTKKKPHHVHACSCRHMCPSSCPTAPIAIRPALSATTDEPRSIAAQPQAPRPAGSCEHSGNCGHLQPGTGAGVRVGPARASCSCRARIAGGMCAEPHQARGLRGCCGAAATWACAPPVDGGKRRAHARPGHGVQG